MPKKKKSPAPKALTPKRPAGAKTARSEKKGTGNGGQGRGKKRRCNLSPVTSSLSHIAEDLRPLAVPIEVLEVDPNNARRHSVQNVLAITESLKRFGQRRPIVANKRNQQIEAGHGLFEAARDCLHWTHVAVVWVDDDAQNQTGFAIADNRTAELADWDNDRLLSLLSDLSEEDGLADFGEFSDALLLAELTGESDHGATENTEADLAQNQPVPESFEVVVACEDEADQKATFDRLTAEGRKCRLVTL